MIGTSNVWEGVTSAGSTANWYAEAAVVSDTTPAIGQLAITPYRSSVWITGSFEVLDDTTLDEQVPALIDEQPQVSRLPLILNIVIVVPP